jgi:multidrug efflux pump subunit AcrA (membrane-fusion protein)
MDNKKSRKEALSEYIIKTSTVRDKRLKYDFMPSLLEIIEKPSHIAGKVIIIGIALLLLVSIIWAALSKINVIVSGTGNISPQNSIVTIKSTISGVVSKINYSDGDYVKAGDLLVTLETENIDAQINKLEDSINRLKIEAAIKNIYLEDVNKQVNVADYDDKYSDLINNIILENKLKLLELERYNGETANIIKLQYITELSGKIAQIDGEIEGYENELKALKLQLENYQIKSPINGCISGMAVNSTGQMVTQADVLLQIVPTDKPLVFEGYIQDKDIANIKIGDVAKIKISAYSYSDYGDIDGRVTYISKSSYQIEGMGNVYKIEVEIDSEGFNEEIKLMSGMSGTVEIDVGKRSVLDYFLEPILQGMKNSLKEQ